MAFESESGSSQASMKARGISSVIYRVCLCVVMAGAASVLWSLSAFFWHSLTYQVPRTELVETSIWVICDAMESYRRQHGSYPPLIKEDSTGRAICSWRVLILPYLGESALEATFNYDEPWDSERNRALLSHMPAVFADNSNNWREGITTYAAIDGQVAPQGASISYARPQIARVLTNDPARVVYWTQPDEAYSHRDFQNVVTSGKPDDACIAAVNLGTNKLYWFRKPKAK